MHLTENIKTPSFTYNKRCINEKTASEFTEAIATADTLRAESVDELLNQFNSNILKVMDVWHLSNLKGN